MLIYFSFSLFIIFIFNILYHLDIDPFDIKFGEDGIYAIVVVAVFWPLFLVAIIFIYTAVLINYIAKKIAQLIRRFYK